MILFTLCVDIKRFDISTLLAAANAWWYGINKSQTSVDKIIVYTNMPLKHGEDSRLEVRPFDESDLSLDAPGLWQNLISLKFKYYSKLLDEFNESPVWIDLDAYVANNIEYMGEIDQFCTMVGSSEIRPMQLVKDQPDYTVVRKDMINTSIFKVGNLFLERVLSLVEIYKGRLPLGDQDAFNIAYHFEGLKIDVLGRTVETQRVLSYDAWNTEIAEHISESNSRNLRWDDSANLVSVLHPGKTIDIVQFCFYRFDQLLRLPDERLNPFLKEWKKGTLNRFFEIS